MSRKHFEALANNLAAVRPGHPTLVDTESPEYNAWLLSVRAVADACGESNARFDRSRFIDACCSR